MSDKVGFLFVRMALITWACLTAVFLSLVGPGLGGQFYTTVIVLLGVASVVMVPFVAQVNDILQEAIDKIISK